jgi:hypothetical protein
MEIGDLGKGFNDSQRKLGQFQSTEAIGGRFTRLCGDLLDAVLWFLQVEDGRGTPGFVQRLTYSL